MAPQSITLYDAESRNASIDLDLDYIDGVAADVAAALVAGKPAEVAYQPGDGTFYGLAFVKLTEFVRARPRVKDGRAWDACAFRGMLHSDDFGDAVSAGAVDVLNVSSYVGNGYLVTQVEGVSYPVRLGGRGNLPLAADYVGEHWKLPGESAVSVAVLLRAVSWHLDEARA